MRARPWLAAHGHAALALAFLWAYAFWGVHLVPFHPDESSLLFQSRDLEALLTHPTSLAWNPDEAGSREQQYRALNAPLAKYLLGLGRRLAGYGPEAVSVDWDWSKDWAANLKTGAYPPEGLLYGARLASTVALSASLILLYLAAVQLGGRVAGVLGVLLLGTDPLYLLHGRRAMAEGALCLGVVLALWGILQADRRPWLAGLGAALAFCAKQSTAPLVAVALLATIWRGPKARQRTIRMNVTVFALVFGAIVLALTPFLWSNPLRAGLAMVEARRSLVSRQVSELGAAVPEQILDSPGKKLVSFVGHVFVSQPQFAEVGNYAAHTLAAEEQYLRVPGHDLLRGIYGGGVMLALTALGLGLAGIRLRRAAAAMGRDLALALAATLAQAATLLVTLPLPFQRYYVPMIPFVALWAGYALTRPGGHGADTSPAQLPDPGGDVQPTRADTR